ncbi:MAG: hypothetical protein WBP54_02080 [Pelodictyon phaeoclathratiforme]
MHSEGGQVLAFAFMSERPDNHASKEDDRIKVFMYSYGIYLDTILQFFLAFSTLPDEDEGNKGSANDPGKILRPDFLIKELQKS